MKQHLFIFLVSAQAIAAIPQNETAPLKSSISKTELDLQYSTNTEREAFLKAELKKKIALLSQIQNGASSPKYLWEDIPANQINRASLEKLLKLAIRRHLDEISRIQQINSELATQLDWMSHEVAGIKSEQPKEQIKDAITAQAPISLSFKCADVPISFASLSERPIMQDFGTRKDTLTGLEWNSLGWWISQKPSSKIRACHKGKVVFSGPMQGRGHVIMIDHGDDFLTIYANIEPKSKHANLGAFVQTGETIGISLDTVYFEVRHKGQAINPRLVFARQNLNILGL